MTFTAIHVQLPQFCYPDVCVAVTDFSSNAFSQPLPPHGSTNEIHVQEIGPCSLCDRQVYSNQVPQTSNPGTHEHFHSIPLKLYEASVGLLI